MRLIKEIDTSVKKVGLGFFLHEGSATIHLSFWRKTYCFGIDTEMESLKDIPTVLMLLSLEEQGDINGLHLNIFAVPWWYRTFCPMTWLTGSGNTSFSSLEKREVNGLSIEIQEVTITYPRFKRPLKLRRAVISEQETRRWASFPNVETVEAAVEKWNETDWRMF